jgi:hypothetical protein
MSGQGVFGEHPLAKNTRLPRLIEMIRKKRVFVLNLKTQTSFDESEFYHSAGYIELPIL